MKRTVEVDIELDGEDLAKELYKMDYWFQAEFLRELSFYYRTRTQEFTHQLSELADEVSGDEEVIRMLEQVVHYLKGSDV